MDKSTEELLAKLDHEIENRQTMGFNFIEILQNTFTKEDACKIIEYYSHCQCCPRHQINRPHLSESKSEENQTMSIFEYRDYLFNSNVSNECMCKCRHMNRFLQTSFTY